MVVTEGALLKLTEGALCCFTFHHQTEVAHWIVDNPTEGARLIVRAVVFPILGMCIGMILGCAVFFESDAHDGRASFRKSASSGRGSESGCDDSDTDDSDSGDV